MAMKPIQAAFIGALGWAGALAAQTLPQDAGSPVPPAVPAPAADVVPQRVTLREFAALVASADELVRVQRLEQDIGNEGVRGARALFEPFAFAALEREGAHVLNSAQDAKQRGLNPGDLYDSQESRLKAGVMVKAGGGADVELSYSASIITNSLQPLANAPSPEHKGYLGVKITQPLLRGAGPEVNRLGIDIADAERRVAGETVRQLLAQRVMEGVHQYLLVRRAEERVRLRMRAFETAGAIEREMTRQQGGGLKSATELTESRSALALRRAQLAQAQQELEEQVNTLQIFLSARERAAEAPWSRSRVMPALEGGAEPAPAAAPAYAGQLQAGGGLDSVLARRPEARISALRVERESRKLEAARDQAKPELNLQVRYGKEDLSTAQRTMQDYLTSGVPYRTWMVGLTWKVGLFGDEKKDSEYQTAAYRKRQAELAVGALHQRIANEVHATDSVLDKAAQQLMRQQEIVQAQRSLLTIEEQLVREGRRSSMDVERKRLEVLLAEEALADAQAQAARASYLAAQADGSLLARLGLE
jgi:outer membrane protein TolC